MTHNTVPIIAGVSLVLIILVIVWMEKRRVKKKSSSSFSAAPAPAPSACGSVTPDGYLWITSPFSLVSPAGRAYSLSCRVVLPTSSTHALRQQVVDALRQGSTPIADNVHLSATVSAALKKIGVFTELAPLVWAPSSSVAELSGGCSLPPGWSAWNAGGWRVILPSSLPIARREALVLDVKKNLLAGEMIQNVVGFQTTAPLRGINAL